jgi:hydrogenase maturation factor
MKLESLKIANLIKRNIMLGCIIIQVYEEVKKVNIKYIGKDTKKSEYGKIHLKKGNFTGCGARIDDNPQDWEPTDESITCDKNGCKN